MPIHQICNFLPQLQIMLLESPIPLCLLLSLTPNHCLPKLLLSACIAQKVSPSWIHSQISFLMVYFFDQLCPSSISHVSSHMLPMFADFLCTSNGLSTYLNWNVIKLPNSSVMSSCFHFASCWLLPFFHYTKIFSVPSCSYLWWYKTLLILFLSWWSLQFTVF